LSLHFEDRDSGLTLDINKLGGQKKIIFGSSLSPIDGDILEGGNKADHLYGMAGADTLNGGAGDDYLEGGTGNDTLNGGEDNDTLVGGEGEDILNGGSGNDQLKGGKGVDVYQFEGSYGKDVITDSDGKGILIVDGTPLTGGKQLLDGIYYNATTQYSYVLLGPEGNQTLYIRKDGDTSNQIIIKNWSATNNLNISFDNPDAAPAATLVGDFKKLIDDQNTADTSDDTYVITDGNYTRDTNALNGEAAMCSENGSDSLYLEEEWRLVA
jgi:hypothetical protein